MLPLAAHRGLACFGFVVRSRLPLGSGTIHHLAGQGRGQWLLKSYYQIIGFRRPAM
jgi:hypothetical protein